MKVIGLLLFLEFSILQLCLGNSPEQTILRPNTIFWRTKNTAELKHSPGILPIRGNNEYVCIFKIDTAVLKQIPNCKIERMDFSFQLWHIEGTGGGTVEIRPLKINIADCAAGKKIKLEELTDWKTPPLISCPLPQKLECNKRYSFSLAPEERILSTLQNGVVISLNQKGGKITQINLSGCQWNKGSKAHTPQLSVIYSTTAEKLKFSRRVKPVSGKYVTAKDGDFFYDGKKIRFSGTNLSAPSGNKEYVDKFIDRLLAMNTNSIRLWLGRIIFDSQVCKENLRFSPSVKGDNSYWDCIDYLCARCQQEGLFIYSTTIGTLPSLPAEDRELGAAAFYVSPKYKKIKLDHIRNYLNRVNLYTGQRYAEMPVFACWEMTNENSTVPTLLSGKFRKWTPKHRQLINRLWNNFLIRKYKDQTTLKKAWGELRPGESLPEKKIEPAPVYGEEKQYPKQRGFDFTEFVLELYVGTNREYEQAARACAPAGIGVNIAPFVHGTHAFLNFHGQYADGAGDVTSCGIYQSPYTKDKKNPYYPYAPFFTRRPYLYNINFQASAKKPFVVYEYSPHWPYRYRAEYVPMIAFLGAGIGWDSLYLYNFSLQSEIIGPSPLAFSGAPLPEPLNTSHGGYTYSFHAASDEVVMSTLAVTSQAFINGIAPNREKTHITFGREAILDPRYRTYSTTPVSKDPIFTELVGGGVMEYFQMPGMYRNMIDASVRTRLGVDFSMKQKTPIRVSGKQLKKIKNDNEILTASPEITWNPVDEINLLDNTHSKIAVGILPAELKFKDGIRFRQKRKMFGFFGISSRDGKPLSESGEIVFALTAESQNTGYRLNPEKMANGPLALIPAIENRGTAPVIVKRPSGTVSVPGKPFILKCYNFAGYCYRTETVTNETFTIEQGEPLFLATLTRK